MFTESTTIELKREYVDDIKKTVIAFANCDGGKIYVGVDDDGLIYGVSDIDSTMLRITNAIRDTVRPDVMMFVDCDVIEVDDKQIVEISVQRGTARPYYLQSKGIRPEGVYVRQGASTVPASDAAILRMIKETSGDSYEAARSLNQQLTFNVLIDYFKKGGLEFGNQQMRTLHLLGEDGTYTNLAFLLSEQCTHTIKMAVFEGRKKTVFRDRNEISGSLINQLEFAYQFIDRYNRTRAEFRGLERIDCRDYPVEAVREALLNAIVHRDYSFSGSTLINIYEDRIEFVSIGGLVKGVSLDDIMLGISVLRNQNLANIFYRLKLIEAYGTGILKINECYIDYPVKPKIEVSSNAFRMTLPNINYVKECHIDKKNVQKRPLTGYTKKDERMNIVLTLCQKNGFVVRKDIESSLKISQATAILLLREMVEDGLLTKKGTAKNVRYYLSNARNVQDLNMDT